MKSTDLEVAGAGRARDRCASTRATARCRPVAYFSLAIRFAPRFSFANGGSQPIDAERRLRLAGRLIHD